MLDFSIVCGGRTDDVVACTLLSKALHKFGKRHDLPFFTFNPFTASKIPFLRIRQKMGIPTMFIGVPLECILQETSNNGLACYISNVLNGDQTSDWIYSDDFYKRNGYHKSGMDCSYLFYDPKNRYIYYFEYNI